MKQGEQGVVYTGCHGVPPRSPSSLFHSFPQLVRVLVAGSSQRVPFLGLSVGWRELPCAKLCRGEPVINTPIWDNFGGSPQPQSFLWDWLRPLLPWYCNSNSPLPIPNKPPAHKSLSGSMILGFLTSDRRIVPDNIPLEIHEMIVSSQNLWYWIPWFLKLRIFLSWLSINLWCNMVH